MKTKYSGRSGGTPVRFRRGGGQNKFDSSFKHFKHIAVNFLIIFCNLHYKSSTKVIVAQDRT